MRRIFYDKTNGEIILEVQPQSESNVKTVEQDISTYSSLSERNRDMFDVIEVPSETYTQDFAECNGYRVNVETGELEFSYPDPSIPEAPPVFQKALSVQVAALEDKMATADERYKALDKTTVALADLKTAKLSQLEEMCDNSIISGFDFTINAISYRFSCSVTAQANFQGSDTLFKDGLITEAEWTVTNNATGAIERIILDQATFNQIKLQVFMHINSNISKLRNTLQPQVESCATNVDVDAVAW